MKNNDVFTKCAWRLVPFMLAIALMSFIDRGNVAFAALAMNKDLALSPEAYGFAAGIFFVGYFFFTVPANRLFERIGARRWLFCILLAWGAVSAATACVKTAPSFYALRFLLGVAEAGSMPGLYLYTTYWFPQAYRARIVACFLASAPLAFIIIGPLSGVILQMDGVLGIKGWQWLFVLEGLPTILLAFVVVAMLPDRPAQAAWLSLAERETIMARLAAESTAPCREFWPALRDPRVLVLGLIYMMNESGGYGGRLWLPQIVKDMGFSNIATGFLVALPNAIAIATMVLWGISSDRKGERALHAAAAPLLAATGFTMAALAPRDVVALAGLSLVTVSVLLVHGPFWSLASALLEGRAAAGGLAVISSIGGLGGFVGPVVIGAFKGETGNYNSGMGALALLLIVEVVIVLSIGRAMARETMSRRERRADA